jgi:hypothetical protein
MANNTFAFVVEGQAISQINIAASLKSAFVGLNFLPGTADGSGTAARFRVPVCITIFHATTTLFVGELARIRRVTRAGDVSVLSGSTFHRFCRRQQRHGQVLRPPRHHDRAERVDPLRHRF